MSPPDTASEFAEVRALLDADHEGEETRAEHGAAVLQTLSAQRTEAFGRGFSVDALSVMRGFYPAYRHRLWISEAVSRIFEGPTSPGQILETVSPETPTVPTRAWTPGANGYARVYPLAFPSADERRLKLLEWTEEP